MLELKIKVLPHGEGLELPRQQTPGSAGLDLRAAIDDHLRLAPGEFAAVPCGICVEIPPGYVGRISGRSGNARNNGISIIHGVGTVDADYRGELHALLINHGGVPFVVMRGDRVAQMVVQPYERVECVRVDDLSDTERGEGGYGSTGRS